MRRRPAPASPLDRAAPTSPTVAAASATRAGVRALLLTCAMCLLVDPASAQSRAQPADTPDPGLDTLRRPTVRTTIPKSTLSRTPAKPSPLRGSLDPAKPGDATDDALAPLPGLDATIAGAPALAPDPFATDPGSSADSTRAATLTRIGVPAPSPTAAPNNQATPTGAPRVDPATGRPFPPGTDPMTTATTAASRRGPVGPVTSTGSVKDGGPSRPLAATQPVPRDLQADKRDEAEIQDDEYAQLGLRSGGFTWLPAIESSLGWSSNVATKAGGASGMTYRVAPELLGKSDWSRHALEIELRGAYIGNTTDHDYDKPTFQGAIRGRVDLGDETRLDLKGTWGHDRQAPSSADNPADTIIPATVDTTTASIGLTRDVGLLALTLRGDIERADYTGGTNASGTALGADVQNNTRHVAALRATWGSKGSIRPFAEVQVSTRAYDDAVVAGSPRDTTGAALKSGIVADLGPTLRGELSTGWGVERPDKGNLPDMSGWLLDGSLVWAPTRLTSIKLDARTSFEATTLTGSTGSISRTVGVTVEHALRRDLVATAGLSLNDKRYVGANLREDDLVLSSGLTYKVDRNIQTFVKGNLERFTSSASGANYDAAGVMVGVRLQR